MKLTLSKEFKSNMSGKIGAFQFEVGVLQDRDHKSAALGKKAGRGNFAGGPTRKKSRASSGKTIGEVLVSNMKRMNKNILSAPFQDRGSDLRKFVDAFFRLVTDKGMSIRRVENLLQAVVRNPILKKKYGSNKQLTKTIKGFDRHLIDTGQMFKSITARAKRVRKKT